MATIERDNSHLMRVLGNNLRELAVLVAAAVQVLDQSGSRALRRKLDQTVNCAVRNYNAAQIIGLAECDWPGADRIFYKRTTPVSWGGRGRSKTDGAPEQAKKQTDRRAPCQIVDFPKLRDARLRNVGDEGGHDAA